MRALSPTEQERCIGGHPLCGSETAGVANAQSSLFEGATYFLTPASMSTPQRIGASTRLSVRSEPGPSLWTPTNTIV